MLILFRKPRQAIYVGTQVKVHVLEVKGNQVRFGIEAPRNISVHREEVFERIQRELASAGRLPLPP